jgi:predicted DNA-binding WGR domain protein
MKVAVNSRYMLHESGTKFYEIVTFSSEAMKRYVSVRRWGKISARSGGGEVKHESFGSAKQQSAAAHKLQAEKCNPKKTGGPYKPSDAKALVIPSGVHEFQHDMLDEVLRKHYSYSAIGDHVLKQLNIGGQADEVSDEASDADLDHLFGKDKKIVVPKVEPIRAQDWASW